MLVFIIDRGYHRPIIDRGYHRPIIDRGYHRPIIDRGYHRPIWKDMILFVHYQMLTI
jgi:hypothetical protein